MGWGLVAIATAIVVSSLVKFLPEFLPVLRRKDPYVSNGALPNFTSTVVPKESILKKVSFILIKHEYKLHKMYFS